MQLVEKFKPDTVVVAANCLEARRIKSLLQSYVEQNNISVFYCPFIISELFAKT